LESIPLGSLKVPKYRLRSWRKGRMKIGEIDTAECDHRYRYLDRKGYETRLKIRWTRSRGNISHVCKQIVQSVHLYKPQQWTGPASGIHLTSNATRVAARRLMEMVEGGAGAEESVSKRSRLESVIPAPQEPPAQPARNAAPAAAFKPPATPLWLSGQLPPAGLQTEEPNRGGRGVRGGQTGPGRGRGSDPSGPMGGHYGRWGRW